MQSINAPLNQNTISLTLTSVVWKKKKNQLFSPNTKNPDEKPCPKIGHLVYLLISFRNKKKYSCNQQMHRGVEKRSAWQYRHPSPQKKKIVLPKSTKSRTTLRPQPVPASVPFLCPNTAPRGALRATTVERSRPRVGEYVYIYNCRITKAQVGNDSLGVPRDPSVPGVALRTSRTSTSRRSRRGPASPAGRGKPPRISSLHFVGALSLTAGRAIKAPWPGGGGPRGRPFRRLSRAIKRNRAEEEEAKSCTATSPPSYTAEGERYQDRDCYMRRYEHAHTHAHPQNDRHDVKLCGLRSVGEATEHHRETNVRDMRRWLFVYVIPMCPADVTSYRLSNLKKLNCSHSTGQSRCHSCLMYVV